MAAAGDPRHLATATSTTGTPATGTPATGSEPSRVIAVVVTYNRRDLLAEALPAAPAQSRAPDAAPATTTLPPTAGRWSSPLPVRTAGQARRNTGGAGGLADGLALALAEAADLVWLMDNITVPEPGRCRPCCTAGRLPGRAAGPDRQPGGVDGRPAASDEHSTDKTVGE